MVTNYLTDPSTAKVYRSPGISELMVDAWLAVDYTMPPDLTWSDLTHLQSAPRSLFLVFEQGKNSPPCAFVLKSDPERDLASDPEFGLHYLTDGWSDVYPQSLREFYGPVTSLIEQLAGDSRPIRVRRIAVMTGLLDQIAEHAIVRVLDFDEDTGELLGMDRDIAADLPQAWRDKVAKEMR